VATKTQAERRDRLEQVVGIIAEKRLSLQNLVAELATETRRGFDRVAARSEETERRMRETDEQIHQTREQIRQTDEHMRQRSREMDERVDKLVLAIGELIRSQNALRA
jgi:ElaB/YqjD/DUF883 family membrane-anchored ribosome-binding protein